MIIKKFIIMISHVVGLILHHAPAVKHFANLFQKYHLFRLAVNIIIFMCTSYICALCIVKYYPIAPQTIDHVKYSAKVANTRLWLENVVDKICSEKKTCTIFGRSFAYHTDKNSGTWCMGHRNMFLNKDYLSRKEIYIDDTCKKFLEHNNEVSLDYDMLASKCHDLATECLFYDSKFKNNRRAFVMCKRDYKIANAISCVALVNGHSLDKYLLALEQFKLNPALSFFGD